MLFKSQNFIVSEISEKNEMDIKKAVRIYNSNIAFLKSHLNVESVTEDWIAEEFKSMQEAGFLSCKIIDLHSDEVVGLMDFKISEETYLSLIMIDGAKRSKGVGSEIIGCFEQYARSKGGNRVRIDVATNYDDTSLKFWENIGFIVHDEIELSWSGREIPAVKMVKGL